MTRSKNHRGVAHVIRYITSKTQSWNQVHTNYDGTVRITSNISWGDRNHNSIQNEIDTIEPFDVHKKPQRRLRSGGRIQSDRLGCHVPLSRCVSSLRQNTVVAILNSRADVRSERSQTSASLWGAISGCDKWESSQLEDSLKYIR